MLLCNSTHYSFVTACKMQMFVCLHLQAVLPVLRDKMVYLRMQRMRARVCIMNIEKGKQGCAILPTTVLAKSNSERCWCGISARTGFIFQPELKASPETPAKGKRTLTPQLYVLIREKIIAYGGIYFAKIAW